MATRQDILKQVLGRVLPRADREAIYESVLAGLPADVMIRAEKVFDLSPDEVVALLGTSSATRARLRKSPKRRLDLDRSDRLMRSVRLLAEAVDVLGDVDRAMQWFRAPIPALRNRRPIDLAITDEGTAFVREELDRIRYGIAA